MVAQTTSVWGLTPAQLHDRFWASRGVQVVRQGEDGAIVGRAELFLLTDAQSLAMFNLKTPVDLLCWMKPRLLFVRLMDRRERGYRERAVTNAQRQFLRFERLYGAAESRLARVALTTDRELTRIWQHASTPREGWHRLRAAAGRSTRHVVSVPGSVYDREDHRDLIEFSQRLVQVWRRPDATIERARHHDSSVWIDADSHVASSTCFIGPVWVGAGRRVDDHLSVVGPSILWDEPGQRPSVRTIQWDQIEPTQLPRGKVKTRPISSLARGTKRGFEIVFAIVALLLTLPFYPLVMFAIWLEDGPPFFFVHRRESREGREFPCIKFRSMGRDADRIKPQLVTANQADGPQFFIADDPRLTRVGRFLRSWNIDELPQFINVLMGHMSVVGPRPSPYHENQYCPPWREARLSVRPGVTGLWQVMRSRKAGCDFQEWIKFDIEYVETANWRLDLWIIWRTVCVTLLHADRTN
jgi:lipopolysaccharide/colanic/teichoic acid biosynthesis glycosyltransferase